jgi:hypothetical protein
MQQLYKLLMLIYVVVVRHVYVVGCAAGPPAELYFEIGNRYRLMVVLEPKYLIITIDTRCLALRDASRDEGVGIPHNPTLITDRGSMHSTCIACTYMAHATGADQAGHACE